MLARITPWQILIVVGAIAAGAAIDRGLIGRSSAPKQSEASAQQSAVSALAALPAASLAEASSSEPAPAASVAPKKSLAAILAERDPRQRASDLEAFINGLSRFEFADALKQLRKIHGSGERDLASRLLIARWAQTDPEGALSFASSNRGFEYVAEDVFQADAAQDVQAALDRAKAITNNDMRYSALRGVLSFIADTDPAAALALARSLGDFPGNEPLTSAIYRQWAAQDPQAAALAAMQDASGGNFWNSGVGQVARSWAAQDPMAAANWALSLTDPGAEARTMSQVMREWARDDLTAAVNWVNGLPPGPSYDSAAAALAASMASSDLQSAISWANNIGNADTRNSALERISREVMWRDPTNGATLLAAAGVPANLIPPPGSGRGRRGR
jgi:hypothetical protein